MMASSIGATLKFGQGIDPRVDKMPVLCISFRAGWSSIIRSVRGAARAYALSPDAVDYAFNDTHSPSATRRQMKMSRLAADGRLLPDELADFQRRGTAQRAASAAAFQDFIGRTLAYKGQRVMLAGPTAGIFQIAATGLEMGLHSVFAPTSFVIRGSGTKGVTLPENYEELMARYYGVPRQNIVDLYAMTESNSAPLVCAYGRKHIPPWQIPLILDRDGRRLCNAAYGHGGVVTGRYAFVDLLAGTYWGAITTGDRVTVSFDRCPCGREGPQILEIARYTDLPDAPDEDKLSCAADMARYVSAALGDQ